MTDLEATAAEAVIKELATLATRGAVKVASASGRIIATYFVSLGSNRAEPSEEEDRTTYPPMIVVGLGRCGSFVTGQLLAMLAQAAASTTAQAANQSVTESQASNSKSLEKASGRSKFASYFPGFFAKKDDDPRAIISVEPKMFMGDIDETVFGDVVRGVNRSDENLWKRILQISYEPLAYGGVGNTPIFSEFLTRGLLLLPPAKLVNKENP